MYRDYDTIGTESTDVAAIKNSIRNIMLTRKGSLPGRPRFGSDLWKVVFSPLDPLIEEMAKNFIREALSIWEDRITVRNITMTREDAYNKLLINIEFVYRDGGLQGGGALDSLAVAIDS